MNKLHLGMGALFSTLCLLAACSSSSSKGGNSGGDAGTGGATGSGGASSGGASSGGASSGGASSGGASSGGASSGGASSGGASSGGAATDGGPSADGGASACDTFCTEDLATCTGALKQYTDQADCLTKCAGFATTGNPGDSSGNTLQCREYHLNAAKTNATLHCPHTGVTSAVCQ